MFVVDTLLHRLKRGCETTQYPHGAPPSLPTGHGGALRLDASACQSGCTACIPLCPTQALTVSDSTPLALDLGRCIFCSACVDVCPTKAISHTNDHRLATNSRAALQLGRPGQEELRLAKRLDEKMLKLLGRSLRLRQVSAGGCNACEADTNVLGTIGWDLSRFGIQFVASPRHADGLLVTGPVSRGMHTALLKTWDAVPEPKLLIAVGACAIAGGPFVGHEEVLGGVDTLLPVDLYIPGCPPHPLTILDGLLRMLDQLEHR